MKLQSKKGYRYVEKAKQSEYSVSEANGEEPESMANLLRVINTNKRQRNVLECKTSIQMLA